MSILSMKQRTGRAPARRLCNLARTKEEVRAKFTPIFGWARNVLFPMPAHKLLIYIGFTKSLHFGLRAAPQSANSRGEPRPWPDGAPGAIVGRFRESMRKLQQTGSRLRS